MPVAAKWSLTVAFLLVGLALATYLLRIDLAGYQHFLPKCTLKSVSGLYCPGCGNTRAAQALLRGDIGGALHQNVVFVIALPFFLLWLARTWMNWVFPGKWKPILPWKNFRWKYGYSLTLVILLVAFSILRNVPVKPFSWMAPVPLEPRQTESGAGLKAT